MYICYIDEAGCLGVPSTPKIQPIFVILGLLYDISSLNDITLELIKIKRKYYRRKFVHCAHYLDSIYIEIKGSDLRKYVISTKSREKKTAIGYLDSVLSLCNRYNIKMVGRLYVKSPSRNVDAKAVYSFSVQNICLHFQKFLEDYNNCGFIIADSRNKFKNVNISHSIFTGKFKSSGDIYANLLELPVFGHSDNHAMIQICDTIVSSLLYPICIDSYCRTLADNQHVKSGYAFIKQRYGNTMKNMQYRYYTQTKWTGGIIVSDSLNNLSGSVLFG
jgi:hypothetical protein